MRRWLHSNPFPFIEKINRCPDVERKRVDFLPTIQAIPIRVFTTTIVPTDFQIAIAQHSGWSAPKINKKKTLKISKTISKYPHCVQILPQHRDFPLNVCLS